MPAYSFKKRFVRPIRAGLGLIGMFHDDAGKEIPCELVVDDGEKKPRPFDPMKDLDPPVRPKRQTIRARGKRRHARPGEIVQLYCGMRTKQCFKIGEGRCTRVRWITIWVGLNDMFVQIEGEKILGPRKLNAFAKSDGFNDARDMAAFWRAEHSAHEIKFTGVLIEWEPIPSSTNN